MINRIGAEDRYIRLLQYLDAGWQIEPPVFIGACKHSLTQFNESYQFMLLNGSHRWMLNVPESNAVEAFLTERNLPVHRL